jgi:hypothetical protein
MASDEAGLRAAIGRRATARGLSPLAHGAFYRLGWALVLSAGLWLAVLWALS